VISNIETHACNWRICQELWFQLGERSMWSCRFSIDPRNLSAQSEDPLERVVDTRRRQGRERDDEEHRRLGTTTRGQAHVFQYLRVAQAHDRSTQK
jgi:hypothetical protein